MTYEPKLNALSAFLQCSIEELRNDGENRFCFYDKEYLVLTEAESFTAAEEYIKETLWIFSPEFLADYMPEGVDADIIRTLQEKCEGCNPALTSMIGNKISRLVQNAISCDGIGRFLSTYDSEEHEQDGMYIYRTN